MNLKSTGANDFFCECLQKLGITCVFGIPGSQNTVLFDALRRAPVQTVLATSESGATFMANGYYRASGKLSAVLTIPGPGFTNALTGLAEAYLDSAALLCITGVPADSPGRRFQLQAIDQVAMAGPVVKACHRIDDTEQTASVLSRAAVAALSGEPGPVLVEVDFAVLDGRCSRTGEPAVSAVANNERVDAELIRQVEDRITAARRPVLFVGQGACEASDQVRQLAELISAPVVATTSGPGILSERHPLSFPFNYVRGGGMVLDRIFETSDMILALGCKLTHNGSGGFQYKLPQDKLIHVDASPDVPGANYPAETSVCADVPVFLQTLLVHSDHLKSNASEWQTPELAQWYEEGCSDCEGRVDEPQLADAGDLQKPADFFIALRELLSPAACVLTDSGRHQFLVRRHFPVLRPRSLIIPSDFQSMAYGIPAAVGAKLAAPERDVYVVVGDGGFAMSVMESLAAVREDIGIKVILFNDGYLGLIRNQQLNRFGFSHAVDLQALNYKQLSTAIGIQYFRLSGDGPACLNEFIKHDGVALLEVRLQDPPGIGRKRAKAVIKNSLRKFL